jgi:hypothetical protein
MAYSVLKFNGIGMPSMFRPLFTRLPSLSIFSRLIVVFESSANDYDINNK